MSIDEIPEEVVPEEEFIPEEEGHEVEITPKVEVLIIAFCRRGAFFLEYRPSDGWWKLVKSETEMIRRKNGGATHVHIGALHCNLASSSSSLQNGMRFGILVLTIIANAWWTQWVL